MQYLFYFTECICAPYGTYWYISFLPLSVLQDFIYHTIVYQDFESKGCGIVIMPSSLCKEGMPMIIMEVLTLLLVIFAALTSIDNKK